MSEYSMRLYDEKCPNCGSTGIGSKFWEYGYGSGEYRRVSWRHCHRCDYRERMELGVMTPLPFVDERPEWPQLG